MGSEDTPARLLSEFERNQSKTVIKNTRLNVVVKGIVPVFETITKK